jgi:hypothetical protein
MMREKFDYVLTAARELQSSSSEIYEIMNQFMGQLKDVEELYAIDRETSNSPLLSLGVTLLVLPEPITTSIGGGLIIIGLAQQKLFGQPLFVKDLYKDFNQNVQDLLANSELFSTMSLPIVPNH